MITLGDALKELLRQKIGEMTDDEVRKRIIILTNPQPKE